MRDESDQQSSIQKMTSDEESEYDNQEEDESYESDEDDGSGRTLLFLCEEGQLDIALERVRGWDERFPTNVDQMIPTVSEFTIRQELFRKNPNTGNYCLHEILAGGTDGRSAPELVERLVRRYRSMDTHGDNYRKVFMVQPTVGSNGRTILHWCAWSKTTPRILRLVLGACPEAMCLRDNKSHFSRTPLEIAQRYWPNDEITNILKSSLETYLPHRVRFFVRLCIRRLFLKPITTNIGVNGTKKKDGTKNQNASERARTLQPFDKKDRRIAGLSPRSWFVSSVLGYAMQREMKGLVETIMSFVGCGAKLDPKSRTKKRRRKSKPATATSPSNRSGNPMAARIQAEKKRKTR